MTSKISIDNRELLQKISTGEAAAGIDFGNAIVRELAAFRLAAMDSEPVAVTDDMAYEFHHALTDSMIGSDDVEEIKTGLRAVFANLTAPVVSAKCPERLPCSVLLEPGLRFGKGIKTSTMLAALARRSVYESEMSALSPEEKAEFQAKIADFKALIAQPAPVVLDNGREQFEEWFKFHDGGENSTEKLQRANGGANYLYPDVDLAWIVWRDSRAAMLAAAPQEVPDGK
ncbi:TPA: hypothetical protein LVL66_004322 [Klebsiella oxytoca]|nr:hypothetical protein [Klebsiella michiganensis]HBM3043989.1 hypothetical protein [Klebsiella oxytoca]